VADTRAIASAVSLYAAHMGELPESLEQLTDEVVNAGGDSAGPFLGSVPTPPAGSPAYRYEIRADGSYRIVGESHGEVIEMDGRSALTAAP
jgi:hypothetical protein